MELHILKIIAEAAADSPPTVFDKPKKIGSVKNLSLNAAYVFLIATGKKPTRSTRENKPYGHFVDFLMSVFAARGVNASVDNVARWAISAMEKR